MSSSNDGLPLTIEGAASLAEQNGVTRAEFDEALKSGALDSAWREKTSLFRRETRAEIGIREVDLTDWLRRR